MYVHSFLASLHKPKQLVVVTRGRMVNPRKESNVIQLSNLRKSLQRQKKRERRQKKRGRQKGNFIRTSLLLSRI